ncbi:Non-specific serine/threonine protein kinase [Lentibacillus sp. JNUCC-1]|uniref:serine/threonine protein kinase n=1 Tax=Lentibacillus sp. JNUCC-1 TaxID=2654513 RepID=UPI0012E73475|nr:protein kinase [Lentibacillus sp. JNUCC-1]MUV38038.1 Non-specific serine/threonine protein kinase [Lentibacillus sp. JNUCC-1]
MNPTSTKPDNHIRPGATITGKWHQHTYVIDRQLGSGAIGTVYLTRRAGKQAALKISEQSASLTVEVNVLKSFAKVQGKRLGPSLLDVDDWVAPNGQRYTFYVMEYINGYPLHTFVRSRGHEWIGVFLMQLLDDLGHLHQSGWVFGDLKTDNLLVTQTPIRLRWVDVGGTTQIGRAVKEYTEFFDRGYWQMGSRKADPGYDLFAVAMVALHLGYPRRFEKGANPKATLMNKLQKARPLAMYRPVLMKALNGTYQSSHAMKRDISQLLYRKQRENFRLGPGSGIPSRRALYQDSGAIAVIALLYYVTSLLFP